MILNKFYAKVEHKCSPEFLVAGNASVCCMSFGRDNAKTYALEKGFGIINIYYKDRIVANSVIWINEPYNCLVLDNIEVHPNYTKFHDILKKLFDNTIIYLLKEYRLNFAVQGQCYNDLCLYDKETSTLHCFQKVNALEVNATSFYTDATNVYPLDYLKPIKSISQEIKRINNKLTKDKFDNYMTRDEDQLEYEIV